LNRTICRDWTATARHCHLVMILIMIIIIMMSASVKPFERPNKSSPFFPARES
jgi:hypothetical protein